MTTTTEITFGPHPGKSALRSARTDRAEYLLVEESWNWVLIVTELSEDGGITTVDIPSRAIGEAMAPLVETHLATAPLTRRDLNRIRRHATEMHNATIGTGRVPYLVR